MRCSECAYCSVNRVAERKIGYTMCFGYFSPFFDRLIPLNKHACKSFKAVEVNNYDVTENKKH